MFRPFTRFLAWLALVGLLATPAFATTLIDDEPNNDSVATAGVQFYNTGAATTTKSGIFTAAFQNDDWVVVRGLRVRDTISMMTIPLADFRGSPYFEEPCDPDHICHEPDPLIRPPEVPFCGLNEPTDCFGEPDTILEIWEEGDTGLEASGDDSENSDDELEDHGSLIRFNVEEELDHYVRAYGFDAGDLGEFVLNITVTANAHCKDGLDNDNDGKIDLDDFGCADANDTSEETQCQDGLDNDGDGFVDFPDDNGCKVQGNDSESPPCSDGMDNDGDGLTDFDGGLQWYGYAVSAPDPHCPGPAKNKEKFGCGLGFESAFLLPALVVARRSLRRRRARGASAV